MTTHDATRDLRLFRDHLQPHLDRFIESKLAVYSTLCDDPFLARLLAYPSKMARGTGKRIRPYVAHLMYHAQSARVSQRPLAEENAMPFWVALELFHLFCLVHDDIIDRGTERYAMPTTQRFVADELARDGRPGDEMHHEHIAISQAVLLGDLIFAWAQQSFYATRGFPEGDLALAQGYFSRMMDEVVLGQMIDVDMTARRSTSLEVIHRKLALKTASYTFIRPMQIGAALAGRGREAEAFCRELGLSLGLAFQLQDDLLDLVGTSAETQKTVLSDLREHQHTYFTQYIAECGTDAEREELQALAGSDLQPSDRARVVALFASSGAIEHGRSVVSLHLDNATRAIDEAALEPRFANQFRDLIQMVALRAPQLDSALDLALDLALDGNATRSTTERSAVLTA